MPKIYFLFFSVFLFLSSYSFCAIDEYINPWTLEWNDISDATGYEVYCEPEGNAMSYNSPKVVTIASELPVRGQALADLGIDTEGITYQLCVTSIDGNGHKSTCSAVVPYFFDITPPAVPHAFLENR